MGSQAINSVREFIKIIVETMPIGPNGVQIGVAQFSNVPRIEMDLNTHATRDSLAAALSGIRPKPGQTVNIGAALDFVRENMFQAQKGSRIGTGVPQFLVLLTSKKSSDSVVQPAFELRRRGIMTIAAGAKTASEEDLRQIAFVEDAMYALRDIRVLSRPAAPQPKAIIDALSTLAGIIVTEIPTEPGRFFTFIHFYAINCQQNNWMCKWCTNPPFHPSFYLLLNCSICLFLTFV